MSDLPKVGGEIITPEKMRDMHRRARIGVAYRLGFHKRIASLFKQRGWPVDEDLVMVCAVACACFVQNARAQKLRRPRAADGLPGGLWPAESFLTTAKQIVDTLELDDIVNNIDV